MRSQSKLISQAHPTLNLVHPTPEVFIWNTIIRSHFRHGDRSLPSVSAPLSAFLRMRFHGVNPDFYTFPFILQLFQIPSYLHLGKSIHAQIHHFGFVRNRFCQTSLINMYSNCGDMYLARKLFDEINLPDLPSWNSILTGYIRIGLVDNARKVFDEMPERNVVSWSSMIDGYSRCGDCEKALQLFNSMEGSKPNEFTMSSVLSACGQLGNLDKGMNAHDYIKENDMENNVIVATGLIDMYVKCGSIDRARDVFNKLGPTEDVMAWTAFISGLAIHGCSHECLEQFNNMLVREVRPNSVTFVGLLSACAHGGLVSEGEAYFDRMMNEFGISPRIQHYGCMVDLYSRAGLVRRAWDLVLSMPIEPDVLIWGSLLSGSRTHFDVEMCEKAIGKLIELEPMNSGAYVLLSNVYVKAGRWKDVKIVRDLMKAKGVKKVQGYSMVDIDGVRHRFVVGDESHPEIRDVYVKLDEIMMKLKMEGYVGDVKEVLLDLDEEEGKEMALWRHSEKLAVAFAILKTGEGESIRVMKNLRICSDCHVAMKMISRVFNREIIVRDCNRFHRFCNGICSCNDFW
ncbi:pentatricopeptide repeat-containing protein At3g62890 [Impatiens glandulifera]|uniref:pentatricopeptide repeat-containing protein At3g62890 n=1 Tax=Impatiens glandulifera TaxID=253017 RepID=UPI001FB09F41|nr:pentatricopeptide repeat-containing protein At3g62890 [Impatiens glandulifera]